MNSRHYTLKSYTNKFYNKHPDSDVKILELLPNARVKVKNKYGICIVQRNNLLNQGKISPQSSVNPTEYFINQVKEIHGDKFDYSKTIYLNMFNKVIIKCKIHNHEFLQLPNAHLQGQGCKLCANFVRSTKIKDFIKNANLKHNDKYNYSLVKYVNCKTKVKIICL